MAILEMNIDQVNSDFNGIKTAITATGVDVADGTATSEYADKVSEVYKRGRQSWWDDYQREGETKQYAYAFYGASWRDEIYEPNYPFVINNGYSMFDSTYITDTKKPITLIDGNVLTTNMFSSTRLVTIRKLIVNENNTFNSNMFSKATALINIEFGGVIASSLNLSSCTKLSLESAISAITHLKDYSGTDNAYTYNISFSSATIDLLNAAGNDSPNGTTWLEYIDSLGWNCS